MPIYSSKFFNQLIEPSWKLLVLELSIYTENVIFGGEIEYTEDEKYKMEDENHLYTRGYESDDEDEKYNVEGLILELIDFAVDLLKRKGVMETLRNMLLTFLLCIKGYCMMQKNVIEKWNNDPDLYITEEFEEENINSIRTKTLGLIKDITQELDEENLLKFLKILINEVTSGINRENYTEVIKLDDYNFSNPYFDKMEKNKNYLISAQEANLLILGTLAEDINLLLQKGLLEENEVFGFFTYLMDLLKIPGNKNNKILLGRVIWCTMRFLSIIKNNEILLQKAFEGNSYALINKGSDMSISLLASQCLSNIAQKLLNYKSEEKTFDFKYMDEVYKKLIKLLSETSEETLLAPIETILDLTKLNKEKALYVPYNSTKLIVDIYAKYYNHPQIGVRILELIKLWCEDKKSANLLLTLFVPFAFFVFDEFFKSLGKDNKKFEEIKKTVMTECGNNDMNFKTSLDMLPVFIYF
jgi:hypothetical protein